MIKSLEIWKTKTLGWNLTIKTDSEDTPVQALLFDSVSDLMIWMGRHLGEPAAMACYGPLVRHRWVEIEGREVCADCGCTKRDGLEEAA